MGFGLGLLNGFEFGLNVECGNRALSIRIGLNGRVSLKTGSDWPDPSLSFSLSSPTASLISLSHFLSSQPVANLPLSSHASFKLHGRSSQACHLSRPPHHHSWWFPLFSSLTKALRQRTRAHAQAPLGTQHCCSSPPPVVESLSLSRLFPLLPLLLLMVSICLWLCMWLWWLWWWLGALCEVKTNEVLGLWICVWVVGFVWTRFGSVNVWFVKCEASRVWDCDHVWFFVEFNSCVRQAVCGLVTMVVGRCFCMHVDEINE